MVRKCGLAQQYSKGKLNATETKLYAAQNATAGLIPLVQKYGVSWVLLFLSEFLISFDASAKLALKLIKNSDKNNNTQETPYFCTRGIRPATYVVAF